MDIGSIAGNLERREDGVWAARSHSEVSYPETGNSWCLEIEEGSFWFRHRNRCIVESMRRFPPSGPLFDVGGGNGFVSKAVLEAEMEAVLVEPGPEGVKNARARGVDPVIWATLEGAGFRESVLPAIGLFDVLEHIEHDEAFLATCRRLLAANGKLYLTTPAYGLLWSYEDDYAGHHRRYTVRKLARKLERAGFLVDFATYIFTFLPLPILLFRKLPSRFGWRREVDLEQERREHSLRGPLGRALDVTLSAELTLLRRKIPLPFGASCLLVARAK
jgi:SAM-dependent methyltransferase